MTALYNALTADASADADIWHGHKSGTLAARPAAAHAGRFYYATDLGVMFYDTGSRWDIMKVNHRVADEFFDDFWWNPATQSPWFDNSTGTGSITGLSTTELNSVANLDTGATSSSRGGITAPHGNDRAWDLTRVPAIFQCRVKIGSASRLNEEIFIGLMDVNPSAGADLDNPATTNSRIGFQKSDPGTEDDWDSVTANAAAPVLNAITGLKDGNFHFFEIVIKSATSIDFYVDGALKFTHTTGLPSGKYLKLMCYIDNTAAASKVLYPDMVKFISARV